jgi:soluble cytochrome b562
MTSTILGSLTLVLLGSSVYIGLKNQTMYEERIQTRIEEDSKNKKKTDSLAKIRAERTETQTQREQKESDVADITKKLEGQKEKNTALLKQIDEKKDQINAQKLKIEQVVEALKELGDIEELIPKVKRIKNSIVQLNADIEAETAKLSSLVSEQKRTAEVMKGYEMENTWRSAVASNPELKTQIGRMYDSHGFVSLPVGNTAGVVSGSTLEVVRDGGAIAKLIVKTVESRTAVAELIPGSLAADTVLMEGDVVRSTIAAAATAAPAEVVAPAAPENAEAAAEAEPAEEAAPAAPATEDIFE